MVSKKSDTKKRSSESLPLDTKRDAKKTKIATSPKLELSSSVMKMKFMAKKALQSENDIETDSTVQNENNSKQQHKIQNILQGSNIIVTVQADISPQVPCRRSFGGFNKVVEKQYGEYVDEKRFDKLLKRNSKQDISDEQMLEHYEKLHSLPRGPSQGQKPHKPPKKSE